MTGCYILFSNNLSKFYVGATQEDVYLRIEKHNTGYYGHQRFTASTTDWKLFLFISTNDYAHAIRIERKLKSMKSVKYYHDLLQYPPLLEKLVSSTWLSRIRDNIQMDGFQNPPDVRDYLLIEITYLCGRRNIVMLAILFASIVIWNINNCYNSILYLHSFLLLTVWITIVNFLIVFKWKNGGVKCFFN